MSFADNVWWTRKARIQLEKRLLSNAFHSQLIMFWYSFFGVGVSIYYLKFNDLGIRDDLAGISWVVFSVLVLCMSVFISGLSFKERAALVKKCYETLKTIYRKSTKVKHGGINETKLFNEYEQVMEVCENHSDLDYYVALTIEYNSSSELPDEKTKLKPSLDRRPNWYIKRRVYFWKIVRFSMFTILYTLPIIVFIILEYFG